MQSYRILRLVHSSNAAVFCDPIIDFKIDILLIRFLIRANKLYQTKMAESSLRHSLREEHIKIHLTENWKNFYL